MEKIINLTEISDQFDALIFDVYGVFWDGKTMIPEALDAMKYAKTKGKIVGVLSNTTMLSQDVILEYSNRGFSKEDHFDFFVTSGDVAREIAQKLQFSFPIITNTYKCFSLVNLKLFDDTGLIETADICTADFIYVGIPFDNQGKRVSPDQFDLFRAELESYLEFKKPMFCANPDLVAQKGDKLEMTQGRIGAEYERMGGKVQWCGKPYPEVFEYTLRQLKNYGVTDKARIAMIGDSLQTDILGAKKIEIKSLLVTDSGILYPQLQAGEKLEDLCSQVGVVPDYVLSRITA